MKPTPCLPTPSLAMAGILACLAAFSCLLLTVSAVGEVIEGDKGELPQRNPSVALLPVAAPVR